MFKKVLISDDLGSINKGVLTVLNALEIYDIHQVQYCDDAYLQIKSAILKNDPFDLFITDLSFKADHRASRLHSGEDIVKQLHDENIAIKTIVFTVEDRFQKVRSLINDYQANAYVCKGRKGLEDLSQAIHVVNNDQVFLSDQVKNALSKEHNLEIESYDLALMKQLSLGHSKDQISDFFKSNNLTPSSLSSIEKRQNKLLTTFKATNATHLISIVKDLGLI